MIILAKNGKQVLLRHIAGQDTGRLLWYLHGLSNDTKMRFGPHPFDEQSVVDFYNNTQTNTGYVAEDISTCNIVAYSIIKKGYLEHDSQRLQSYGMLLSHHHDCTFAPSVADDWQSCGVGNALFQFILSDLASSEINRIILWGGVQASNTRAVNYYYKHGFKKLGEFYYNGENYDMSLTIDG